MVEKYKNHYSRKTKLAAAVTFGRQRRITIRGYMLLSSWNFFVHIGSKNVLRNRKKTGFLNLFLPASFPQPLPNDARPNVDPTMFDFWSSCSPSFALRMSDHQESDVGLETAADCCHQARRTQVACYMIFSPALPLPQPKVGPSSDAFLHIARFQKTGTTMMTMKT